MHKFTEWGCSSANKLPRGLGIMSEYIEILDRIIEAVTSAQDTLIGEKEPITFERIKSAVDLASVILGFSTIPVIIFINRLINEEIIKIKNPLTDPLTYFVVFYVLPIILEIPLLWTIPKIGWYKTIMKICRVGEKEVNIYDSMIPLEEVILNYAFPKIRRLLDTS